MIACSTPPHGESVLRRALGPERVLAPWIVTLTTFFLAHRVALLMLLTEKSHAVEHLAVRARAASSRRLRSAFSFSSLSTRSGFTRGPPEAESIALIGILPEARGG